MLKGINSIIITMWNETQRKGKKKEEVEDIPEKWSFGHKHKINLQSHHYIIQGYPLGLPLLSDQTGVPQRFAH